MSASCASGAFAADAVDCTDCTVANAIATALDEDSRPRWLLSMTFDDLDSRFGVAVGFAEIATPFERALIAAGVDIESNWTIGLRFEIPLQVGLQPDSALAQIARNPSLALPSRLSDIACPTGSTALVGPVTAKLALDKSSRAGTDRVKGLAMVAALDPVAPGSSISHWDTGAIPNQLMEPSINIDLTSSITPPEDLTASQMTDIGWFSDADGVPDGADNCIGSDLKTTVVIDGCDSRAGNDLQVNGCSVADDVGECAVKHANKPLLELACVAKETDRLRRAKIITVKEQAGIPVCSLLTLGR